MGDGQEDEFGHEVHGIAWGPVFAGFLVVFLVKAAHQFLEDGAHAMVVDTVWGEVDFGVEKLADQRPEGVCLGKGRELVAELKVLDDIQHIGRKAV